MLPQSFQDSFSRNQTETGRMELRAFAAKLGVNLSKRRIENYVAHFEQGLRKSEDEPVRETTGKTGVGTIPGRSGLFLPKLDKITGFTIAASFWTTMWCFVIYVSSYKFES